MKRARPIDKSIIQGQVNVISTNTFIIDLYDTTTFPIRGQVPGTAFGIRWQLHSQVTSDISVTGRCQWAIMHKIDGAGQIALKQIDPTKYLDLLERGAEKDVIASGFMMCKREILIDTGLLEIRGRAEGNTRVKRKLGLKDSIVLVMRSDALLGVTVDWQVTWFKET